MLSHVEVLRGRLVETRHRVHAVVTGPDGRLHAQAGDPSLVTFWRSASKFFQAAPLLTSGAAAALGLGDEALALACSSHNGEPRHLDVARSMLAALGLTESDLHCGGHPSLNEDIARSQIAAGTAFTRVYSNCSGKHAGMLALATHHGWPVAGYQEPGHPVQQASRTEVAQWAGLSPDVPFGTDGCGVPTFALPLVNMALAYARVAMVAEGKAAPVGDQQAAAVARLVRVACEHPFLLAGTGRLDTELITATGGRVVAKVGADGVYCAALRDLGLGVAVKIEDGSHRALGPALLAILDVIAPGAVPGLDAWRHRPVLNTNGVVVGEVRARVEMTRGAPK